MEESRVRVITDQRVTCENITAYIVTERFFLPLLRVRLKTKQYEIPPPTDKECIEIEIGHPAAHLARHLLMRAQEEIDCGL